MELIEIILFLLIIALVFYNIKQINFKKKTNIVKKSEIIKTYEESLQILSTKEEKITYLKQINQELNRNIFFDQDEIKQVIQNLTKNCI